MPKGFILLRDSSQFVWIKTPSELRHHTYVILLMSPLNLLWTNKHTGIQMHLFSIIQWKLVLVDCFIVFALFYLFLFYLFLSHMLQPNHSYLLLSSLQSPPTTIYLLFQICSFSFSLKKRESLPDRTTEHCITSYNNTRHTL